MRRSKRLLGLSLAALAVVLGGAFWLMVAALSDPPPQRLRLPDGSIVTLEAVTYGKQKVLRGAWWRKLYYWILPDAQKDRAGCRVFTGFRDGALTFHTYNLWSKPGQRLAYITNALDEHGCQTDQHATYNVEDWYHALREAVE